MVSRRVERAEVEVGCGWCCSLELALVYSDARDGGGGLWRETMDSTFRQGRLQEQESKTKFKQDDRRCLQGSR